MEEPGANGAKSVMFDGLRPNCRYAPLDRCTCVSLTWLNAVMDAPRNPRKINVFFIGSFFNETLETDKSYN